MSIIRKYALAGLAFFAGPVFANPAQILPSLGAPEAGETVITSDVAPGVQYHRILRGDDQHPPIWFISFGLARDPQRLDEIKSCANMIGLPADQVQFSWPGGGSLHYTEVTAGAFLSRDQALHYVAAHPLPESCPIRITASPLYPIEKGGPWRVHVVEIDPKSFSGGWKVAHGGGLATGRRKTSEIAREMGAVVAVNGGYFVMEPGDGVVGESAGLSVLAGRFQSEPSRHRPWVVFPDPQNAAATMRIPLNEVTPRLEWNDGTSLLIDGVNRQPDMLRNCGSLASGADQIVWHDRTCHPADQLIAITPDAGFDLHTDREYLAVILSSDGRLYPSNNLKPGKGEVLLIATGQRRAELSNKMSGVGSVKLVVPLLTNLPQASVVSAGPTLIQDGKPVFDELREGWPFPSATDIQANDMHRFVVLRAPRTAIGLRRDGTILLVVVDGWRFADDRQSAVPLNGGASIDELRQIMLDLGADQAMNLDGGGSSTLVINGNVVNQPSDATGERAIGDAILLIPALH